MRELRFDGLSPDGTRLVLAGNDGQKYSVVIDERLEAAVRRDRARMSQVELEQSGMLRPREIQARIRSGATAEDVAAASGLPLERIRRFEGPVLTERAWVAQQAQATEVRRPEGDIELGRLVAERLASIGVEASDVAWDAWRRDDGLWVVIATFPVPPNTHVATWTYDSGGRTMTMVDANARALSAADAQGPLELAAARPTLTAVAPLAENQQEDAAHPVDEPHVLPADAAASDEAALVDEGSPDVAHTDDVDEGGPGLDAVDAGDVARDADNPDAEIEDEGVGPTADAVDVPLFEAPEPPVTRPPGKPHIPSFDDILFGPGRPQ